MVGRWGPRRLGLCVLVLWGMGTPIHAQVGAGALTGDVRDQAGAALPGAKVVATEIRTKADAHSRDNN